MRNATAIVAALLVMAGSARAQVAAPALVPVAPQVVDPTAVVPQANFTPANPAAMQWGAPSRIGAGTLRSRRKSDDPAVPEQTYQGNYGGLRLVGETLSLAAETVSLSEVESTFPLENRASNGALAFQLGGLLALGAGYGAGTLDTGTVRDEVTFPSAGVSLRLAEHFFLGGALGEDRVAHRSDDPLAPDFDATRRVEWYGAGFRSGGAVLIHAEYYVENRRHFRVEGFEFGGYRVETGVLELNVWNLVLAGRVGRVDTKAAGKDPQAYSAADIGWAPLQGLTLLVHGERLEDEVGGTKQVFETTAVSLGYQF